MGAGEMKNSTKFLHDGEFVDYYKRLDLDRTWTTKQLREETADMLKEFNGMLSSTQQDKNPEVYDELEETMDLCRKAFVIFSSENARNEYDLFLDEYGKEHPNESKTEELWIDVNNFYQNERYDMVVTLCEELLKVNKNSEDVYTLLCKAHYDLGNYDKALEILDKAAAGFKRNIDLRRFRIRINIEMGNYQRAQQLLNEAFEEFPEIGQFFAEQAYLYFKIGNKDMAQKEIENYISKYPTDLAFREKVADDLLRLAQCCCSFIPETLERVIMNKESYQKCLEYITLANQINNSAVVQEELERIKFLGKTTFSWDGSVFKRSAVLIGISGILFMVVHRASFILQRTTDINILFGWLLAVFIMLFFVVAGITNFRLGMWRKNWMILRDEVRGYSDYDRSIWKSVI